ncbi:hypothetical protein Q3G72_027396 [Acer saccharum]|nr:hypothetical protein Q3G72_027396 [Acer saccharum]
MNRIFPLIQIRKQFLQAINPNPPSIDLPRRRQLPQPSAKPRPTSPREKEKTDRPGGDPTPIGVWVRRWCGRRWSGSGCGGGPTVDDRLRSGSGDGGGSTVGDRLRSGGGDGYGPTAVGGSGLKVARRRPVAAAVIVRWRPAWQLCAGGGPAAAGGGPPMIGQQPTMVLQ